MESSQHLLTKCAIPVGIPSETGRPVNSAAAEATAARPSAKHQHRRLRTPACTYEIEAMFVPLSLPLRMLSTYSTILLMPC